LAGNLFYYNGYVCKVFMAVLAKGVLNNIYPLQMGPSVGMDGRMDTNLDIATKKTLSSTVEAIHALIKTLGITE
jgi:hypothetical protein